MKFGKYLEDVQIPEWKHVYIPYAARKKRIKQWASEESPGRDIDQSFETILKDNLQILDAFFIDRERIITTQFETLYAETNRQPPFKDNCIILYNHCDYLQNFQIVNKVAVGKLLKKYDKHLQRNLSNNLSSLTDLYVFQSVVPSHLKDDILDLLLTHVYNGDRKKAMRRLRPATQKILHPSAFRVGLFIGASVPLIIYCIQKVIFDQLTYKAWSHILYLYGSLFLIILALFGYAINIYICTKYHINYVFILELDRRSTISFMQIAEIASILLCLESVALLLTVSGWTNPYIDHIYLPLILYGVYLAMLICPLPILYPRTRWWFLRTLSRIVLPIKSIRFADFFLADLMISLTFFWTSIYLSSCFYLTSPYSEKIPIVCNVKTSWISASLISWSLIVRMIQCARKFYDDDYNVLHLKNVLKYTLACTTVYLSTVAAIRGRTGGAFVAWITMSLISSLASFTWDILIDWGVFRSERIFPRWTMVVISVLDVALRLTWVMTLSPTFIASNNLLAFGLAVLEICRRYIWSLFRLEHEHSNNVEHYRAVKDIPQETLETV